MQNVRFLEEIFDKKKISILKLFLKEKEAQFYLREIANKANVPIATTSRFIQRCVHMQLIKIIKIKKFKLYMLENNEYTRFLEQFLKDEKRIIEVFVDLIKGINEVNSVILYGEEKQDRANILLIGQNIDAQRIKESCTKIKEQYNFTISPLSLTKEQYQQMCDMGLYSGNKTILFERRA